MKLTKFCQADIRQTTEKIFMSMRKRLNQLALNFAYSFNFILRIYFYLLHNKNSVLSYAILLEISEDNPAQIILKHKKLSYKKEVWLSSELDLNQYLRSERNLFD